MNRRLRLYRPSCGSEGADFIDWQCSDCKYDHAHRASDGFEPGCEIIVKAMVYHTDDERYPREWRYDEEGHPHCTKYKEYDENEGRREPDPPDPTQMVLIADPTEDLSMFPSQPAEEHANV